MAAEGIVALRRTGLKALGAYAEYFRLTIVCFKNIKC